MWKVMQAYGEKMETGLCAPHTGGWLSCPHNLRVWMCAYTHRYTYAHAHTHTERGLEGVPVKPFCGNDFFTEKAMKANRDLASNCRVGYPG